VPSNEYLIFLDESEKHGVFFSNFYGGVIVGSDQYERITTMLRARKSQLNFHGEVKWSKVTATYLDRYIILIQTFFAEVAADNLRVRIMFRQNAHTPQNLTKEQIEGEYFRLYYQFVKHAFGLLVMPHPGHPVNIRLYFDDLPDKEEKRQMFKGYVLGLASHNEIVARNIFLRPENITEVRSHDHVLLQCLDIVLGAMAFRLNDKHLEKTPGKRTRGKRTVAKEALYKAIYAEIRKLRPNFNIGISTGNDVPNHGSWSDPYRHWKFVPKGAAWDPSLTKAKK
jgi:uncharacterized protein DUF3800